jgi:hypothetical protein
MTPAERKAWEESQPKQKANREASRDRAKMARLEKAAVRKGIDIFRETDIPRLIKQSIEQKGALVVAAGTNMVEAYTSLGLRQYVCDPGFAVNAHNLSLDSLDVHIISVYEWHHWKWGRYAFPFPSTVAECVSRSTQTVKDRLARMVSLGLASPIRRSTATKHANVRHCPNGYDFSGLIHALRGLQLDGRFYGYDQPIEEKPAQAADEEEQLANLG